jgi:hypothetical protein
MKATIEQTNYTSLSVADYTEVHISCQGKDFKYDLKADEKINKAIFKVVNGRYTPNKLGIELGVHGIGATGWYAIKSLEAAEQLLASLGIEYTVKKLKQLTY